ncbi:MAG: thioredoxin [Clostridia bacterium]|nr:thioredoxin [Clostridia bacterium]
MIKNINESEFEKEVIESKGLVVVDFFANWCPPCQLLMPVMEEIAKEEKVTILKINLDTNSVVANEYSVSSIPTLIIFKDGIQQDRIIGYVEKEKIIETIRKYI